MFVAAALPPNKITYTLDLIGSECLPWEQVHDLGHQGGNGLGDVNITDIQVGHLLDKVQKLGIGVHLVAVGTKKAIGR
jgi:hypothetical protein